MSDKEHKLILKDFRLFAKKISGSREQSLNFLVGAGICTPKGKLTKAYSTQPVPAVRKKK